MKAMEWSVPGCMVHLKVYPGGMFSVNFLIVETLCFFLQIWPSLKSQWTFLWEGWLNWSGFIWIILMHHSGNTFHSHVSNRGMAITRMEGAFNTGLGWISKAGADMSTNSRSMGAPSLKTACTVHAVQCRGTIKSEFWSSLQVGLVTLFADCWPENGIKIQIANSKHCLFCVFSIANFVYWFLQACYIDSDSGLFNLTLDIENLIFNISTPQSSWNFRPTAFGSHCRGPQDVHDSDFLGGCRVWQRSGKWTKAAAGYPVRLVRQGRYLHHWLIVNASCSSASRVVDSTAMR